MKRRQATYPIEFKVTIKETEGRLDKQTKLDIRNKELENIKNNQTQGRS